MRNLPTLNAFLNAIAAGLLIRGYFLIRQGRREEHQRTMLLAFATSALFLISYLVYHFNVGSVRFQGTGVVRTVYFSILLTHTVLAAAVAPLVIMVLHRALKVVLRVRLGSRRPISLQVQRRSSIRDWERHSKLARITLPIWLYVSVTGVVIYLMLYHL
jgi:uncharacterized membrane protein YozB (DUF420 family)